MTRAARIVRMVAAHRPGGAAVLPPDDALPSLVLERFATPRDLPQLSMRFAEAGPETPPPEWPRDEVDGLDTFSDACRTLGAVLAALGAGALGRIGGGASRLRQ